jgi:hypothetical protein
MELGVAAMLLEENSRTIKHLVRAELCLGDNLASL